MPNTVRKWVAGQQGNIDIDGASFGVILWSAPKPVARAVAAMFCASACAVCVRARAPVLLLCVFVSSLCCARGLSASQACGGPVRSREHVPSAAVAAPPFPVPLPPLTPLTPVPSSLSLLHLAVSDTIPDDPVFAVKTGLIYSRRLVEKAIKADGKCPVTDADLSLDDLVPVQSKQAQRRARAAPFIPFSPPPPDARRHVRTHSNVGRGAWRRLLPLLIPHAPACLVLHFCSIFCVVSVRSLCPAAIPCLLR